MENIYHIIGFCVFWAIAIIIAVFGLGLLFMFLVNKITNFFNVSKLLIEFAWKRKEFKEWVETYEDRLQEERDKRKTK